MNRISTLLILFSLLFLFSCSKALLNQEYKPLQETVSDNQNHPLRDSLQKIMQYYLNKGIPGMQVVVKNNDGWLYLSGGLARIESRDSMLQNSASWLFSISKTYTAVLIFKLKEEGKINLDHTIREYLPEGVSARIPHASEISVRMLLNHTSGIDNVTELPAFQLQQLNNPLQQPSLEDHLQMLALRPLLFSPGTDYFYSNSNYLLLKLVAETVTGKSYKELMQAYIVQPLQLEHTYMQLAEADYVSLGFPNYYFDRYANSQLENVSKWNAALANASEGYGSIAATPKDVIQFYDALIHGYVLSNASLNEMKLWVQSKQSTEPEYGEGFEYWQYREGSAPQFGHEGDGIGSSTQIFVVPDNNTIIYINLNVGRQLFGPYLFNITDFKRAISNYVANYR